MSLRRVGHRQTGAAGFTLVEILAAMVFMGVLIPAIISALLLSNRAAVIAERATIASQLAENKIDELMIDNAWQSAGKNGDFGADYPGYRWESTQTNWQTGTLTGSMTELSLDVFYTVQGQERKAHFTTLVNSALGASPSPSASTSSGL